MTEKALVLFAHGSRDPQWVEPFETLRQKIALGKPGLRVELAFLELMQPSLPDVLDHLASADCAHVTIAPMFMGKGAHLRRDLTELVARLRAQHPGIAFVVLPAVGEAEPVLASMAQWVSDQL